MNASTQIGLTSIPQTASSGYVIDVGGVTEHQNGILLNPVIYGSIDIGGINVTSAGSYDFCLVKYASVALNNTMQWVKCFGRNNTDHPVSVDKDSNDNIIVGGYFDVRTNYGGSDLVSAGIGTDGFILKLNSTGDHVWSFRVGGSKTDQVSYVAVDTQNNLLLTGYFDCTSGDVSLGGPNVTCRGQTDLMIAKYDSNGQFIWQTTVAGPSFEYSQQVTTDYADNVIAVGWVTSSWWIVNGTANVTGSTNCLVLKYNSNGQLLWYSKQNYTCYSVSEDSTGNVFVSGDASNNVLLLKFAANGTLLWKTVFGNGNQYGSRISVSADDTIYQTGQYNSPVTVNTTLSGSGTLSSSGSFLASYAQNGSVNWIVGFAGSNTYLSYCIEALSVMPGAAIAGSFNSFMDLNSQSINSKTSSYGAAVITVIAPNASPSPSASPSATPSRTPTSTPSPSSSASVTPSPSVTPSGSSSPSSSSSPSPTCSATSSVSASPSVLASVSPSNLFSPSPEPSSSTSSHSDESSSSVLIIALLALGGALLAFYAIRKKRTRTVIADPDDL